MDLSQASWGTVSVASLGWFLVGVFVTAMWKGRVVPRSALDDAIHDRDEWRAESRIKDQQISEKDEQLRHTAEVGETQKAVLSAITKLTGQEIA